MRRTKRLVNTDTQRQGAARCMMETGVETGVRPLYPQIWLTDITYIATDEGWLYLAGVKDV